MPRTCQFGQNLKGPTLTMRRPEHNTHRRMVTTEFTVERVRQMRSGRCPCRSRRWGFANCYEGQYGERGAEAMGDVLA